MKLNGGGIVVTLIWLGFMFLIFVSRQNEYAPIPRPDNPYTLPPNTTLLCTQEGCVYAPVCITTECYNKLFEEEK